MKRAKKFFRFIFCTLTVLCLIGCKLVYSEPVNPKIIGTAHIQSEKGLVFVEIDSVRYAVDKVFTGKHDSRSGEDITIDATEGMLVTAFTADNSEKVQFVVGTKTVAEIENMFRHSRIILFACGFMLIGCIIMLVVFTGEQKNKEEIPIARAE